MEGGREGGERVDPDVKDIHIPLIISCRSSNLLFASLAEANVFFALVVAIPWRKWLWWVPGGGGVWFSRGGGEGTGEG